MSADKKLWLKPGTRLFIGRTHPNPNERENGAKYHAIQDKSVSRQHLIIEVKPVKAGASTRIHEKSELTITDDSKLGTTVDGVKFRKTTRSLTGNDHIIKLGKLDVEFHIHWRPAVLTVMSVKPSQKASSSPPPAMRAKLEPHDIKLALEYMPGITTHVVATKRNTPPTLSALIEGRPIVTEKFVEMLAAACSARDAAAADALPSLLEDDFDAGWPVEMGYLPPPGREPVTRGPEFFAPRPERAGVFEGFTFVFVDPAQFAALQPVVAVGGGKAALFEAFRAGETPVEDFVAYVKGKGHGEWVPGDGKGPVVVRWAVKAGDEWGMRFCNEADLALGQRSVLQNEFLDAILVNDASGLRRALEFEESMLSSTAPAAQNSRRDGETSTAVVESSIPEQNSTTNDAPVQQLEQQVDPSQISSTLHPRRQRRALAQPRYIRFGDFDQPSVQDSNDVLSDDSIPADTITQQPSKKRPAQHSDDSISPDDVHRTKRSRANGNDDSQMRVSPDVVDEILPAAAAMRRKKMHGGVVDDGNGITTYTKTAEELAREAEKARLEKARRRRDRGAEIDVNEEVRRRRQREMEDAEAEEERIRQGLVDVDVAGLRDVAVVEEMSLPARLASAAVRRDDSNTEHHVEGREWKSEWNGRKNFKGFRPKRASTDTVQPSVPSRSRIIVRLEEVKKKAFGIGDEYWGESSNVRTQPIAQKPSQTSSQRLSTSLLEPTPDHPSADHDHDSDDDESQFRRSRRSAKSQPSAAKSQSQAGKSSLSSAVVGAEPSHRAAADRSPQQPPPLPPPTDHSLRSRAPDSQRSKTASPAAERAKRKAGDAAGAERPAKKGRVVQDSDESDGDGLSFRRKRR